jgi:hypothetical protein
MAAGRRMRFASQAMNTQPRNSLGLKDNAVAAICNSSQYSAYFCLLGKKFRVVGSMATDLSGNISTPSSGLNSKQLKKPTLSVHQECPVAITAYRKEK